MTEHEDDVAVEDLTEGWAFEPGQVTVGEFDPVENALLDRLHESWKAVDGHVADLPEPSD